MDSYNVPNAIAEKTNIAQAATIDGRVVTVAKVRYALPIRGLDNNEGFVVDVGPNTETGAIARGFVSEDQAMQFLSEFGEYETTDLDSQGNERKITVTGLGIPEGMISRRQDKTAKLQADMPSAPTSSDRLPIVNATDAGQRADTVRIKELEAEVEKYRRDASSGSNTGDTARERSALHPPAFNPASGDSDASQRPQTPYSEGAPRDLLSSGESR